MAHLICDIDFQFLQDEQLALQNPLIFSKPTWLKLSNTTFLKRYLPPPKKNMEKLQDPFLQFTTC